MSPACGGAICQAVNISTASSRSREGRRWSCRRGAAFAGDWRSCRNQHRLRRDIDCSGGTHRRFLPSCLSELSLSRTPGPTVPSSSTKITPAASTGPCKRFLRFGNPGSGSQRPGDRVARAPESVVPGPRDWLRLSGRRLLQRSINRIELPAQAPSDAPAFNVVTLSVIATDVAEPARIAKNRSCTKGVLPVGAHASKRARRE